MTESWRESKGQFPSAKCECHYQEPYGFVPEADCVEHDNEQFLSFVAEAEKRGRDMAIKEIKRRFFDEKPNGTEHENLWRTGYGVARNELMQLCAQMLLETARGKGEGV